ncbi:ArsR/SmtB family transcription factor [Nonomuraea zeae]|uniref:Winged helix-turn-helix transcriptional regulator n=1 Tax=Nonomuraea zeae TaxID=1642303 RepID=A0A5S4FRP4_9ACTN|nr:winged helix-turn-helix domain-containing protein [Nonomuraea zeae]TMR23293.1 winged helix-turn-helix transcriptional regulator [Nonomuraea zeae]
MGRIRMSAGLGLVAEGAFALDLFRRKGAVFDGWRKQVRRRLGVRATALEPLLRERLSLTELLETLRGGAAGSGAEARVPGLVFEFCRAGVVPYWDRVQSQLEAERAVRGRIGITTGVEGLLGTLHPNVEWAPPVLKIRDDEERDVSLRGRGLMLSPSLFLRGRSCVVIDAGDERPPALVYSMRADVADIIGAESPPEQALGALVGHTRAAALQALAESCTTGELAQRLGISLAGASKHATVLRRAGLANASRSRNTVLHTLTPLGVALLQRREPAQAH